MGDVLVENIGRSELTATLVLGSYLVVILGTVPSSHLRTKEGSVTGYFGICKTCTDEL